jgi:hypothetical protein
MDSDAMAEIRASLETHSRAKKGADSVPEETAPR